MSASEEYARWVLDPDNHFSTGEFMKQAAKRFLNDLERDDIYFDEEQANYPIRFIEENLNHWEDKWRGKPVILEPWQKFILQQIYGWIIKESGLRRIRFVFIETGKKNAKTALASFISLFHLFADRINSPKVFVGANNHEQANICVNYSGKTIENSPNLADYLDDESVSISKYNGRIHTINHNERDGFIETMAKEPASQESKQAGGKHGKSPSLVIIDEYAMADSDALLNAMENAQGAREEPLSVVITTAGPKKEGPCYQKLRDTGIKVLNGVINDDSYLAFIFEMDKPLDEDGKPQEITIDYLIDHPEVWPQSNPNYKVSVFDAFLRSQLTKAQNERGTKEVDVLTFNFNTWVGSPDVFIPAEIWNSNSHGIDEEELYGAECYGGIEIVSGKMMNAFVLLFPNINGKIVIKPFFWMPEDFKKTYDDYPKWIDDELIWCDSGNVVDNDYVFNKLIDELSKYTLNSFAFKNGLENYDVIQKLIKAGHEGNPISHGLQGISTPTIAWEELLTSKSVEHFNNPVLTWMNSNCMAVRKNNEIRLQKSGSKVVGIYAAINALAQYKTSGDNGEIGILYL